jgi:hypothetical protein
MLKVSREAILSLDHFERPKYVRLHIGRKWLPRLILEQEFADSNQNISP